MVTARRVKENCKKIQKIEKFYYGFFSSQNRLEKAEKEKKQNLSFRFVPTRPGIENSKKVAKKLKKLKNTITDSFHTKIGWKRLRRRGNKNYHPVSFLPNP